MACIQILEACDFGQHNSQEAPPIEENASGLTNQPTFDNLLFVFAPVSKFELEGIYTLEKLMIR